MPVPVIVQAGFVWRCRFTSRPRSDATIGALTWNHANIGLPNVGPQHARKAGVERGGPGDRLRRTLWRVRRCSGRSTVVRDPDVGAISVSDSKIWRFNLPTAEVHTHHLVQANASTKTVCLSVV
jgi:hypothetical protein